MKDDEVNKKTSAALLQAEVFGFRDLQVKTYLLFVKFCIFLLNIEAGAELGNAGEVAVTYNLGLGIGSLEFLEQIPEGLFLISGAGVSPAASFILAANVANADGMLIVILDMSTSELLGTAGMN